MLKTIIALAIAAGFATTSFAQGVATTTPTTPTAKLTAPVAAAEKKVEAPKSVEPAKTEAVKATEATKAEVKHSKAKSHDGKPNTASANTHHSTSQNNGWVMACKSLEAINSMRNIP